MDITPVLSESLQVITQYGGGGFTINEKEHTGSVLVFAERTLAWAIADAEHMDAQSLKAISEQADRLDMLIIGSGKTQLFVEPELRDQFRAQGITIEAMDTGAACRTFNVLLAEERRVAAALIAV